MIMNKMIINVMMKIMRKISIKRRKYDKSYGQRWKRIPEISTKVQEEIIIEDS